MRLPAGDGSRTSNYGTRSGPPGAVRNIKFVQSLCPGLVVRIGRKATWWTPPAACRVTGRSGCTATYGSACSPPVPIRILKILEAIDVPTLVMHGDDDQVVPIADSALLSAKAPQERHPEVHEKFLHGMRDACGHHQSGAVGAHEKGDPAFMAVRTAS